jgi:hypothetical protein
MNIKLLRNFNNSPASVRFAVLLVAPNINLIPSAMALKPEQHFFSHLAEKVLSVKLQKH